MQKAQVFLRDDQKKKLKEMAARTGRKHSALIREGVYKVFGSVPQQSWRRYRRCTHRFGGAGARSDARDPK